MMARDLAGIRRQAREAMGVARNKRVVTCAIHGISAPIEDVFVLNNWQTDADGFELRCDEGHPYCFGWCRGGFARQQEEWALLAERTSRPKAERDATAPAVAPPAQGTQR